MTTMTPRDHAPVRHNPNNGLRVLAVDDEPPVLAELVHLLRADAGIVHADGVTDSTQALRYLHDAVDSDSRLDAVFLDLRMPGLNGLDLARTLVKKYEIYLQEAKTQVEFAKRSFAAFREAERSSSVSDVFFHLHHFRGW